MPKSELETRQDMVKFLGQNAGNFGTKMQFQSVQSASQVTNEKPAEISIHYLYKTTCPSSNQKTFFLRKINTAIFVFSYLLSFLYSQFYSDIISILYPYITVCLHNYTK